MNFFDIGHIYEKKINNEIQTQLYLKMPKTPTEISDAAKNGDTTLLETLIPQASESFLNGSQIYASPLLEAISAQEPQIEAIELLLNANQIDVNVSDATGSCLFWAVKHRKPNALKAFKLLLEHPNIDVNPIYGPFHITPLHVSILRNDAPEYLVLLLAHEKTNVKVLTAKGQNVFHFRPNINILSILLESPKTNLAMITATDNDENTPLDIAIKNGDIDVVNRLLPYYTFFQERMTFLLCSKNVNNPLPMFVNHFIFSFLKKYPS